MLKIYFISILALMLISAQLHAQGGVAINSNGTIADNSAMLDIKSSNKGVLIPRVSTVARKAIASPATGLMVYDSTESTLYMFDGSRWLGFQAMPDDIRPVSKMLFAPDMQDSLFAGYSVSVSDEFAVIGAPYRNLPASMSGGAYVYRRNGDSWNYFTTLSPSSGALDTTLFGSSVNICGNNIIVGAPYKENAIGQHIGAAYIFQFNGFSWVNAGILWGNLEYSGFGSRVEINEAGNYAAVSEPSATVGAFTAAGVVRVYNKLAGWTLQTSLSDPSPAAYESFGTSMAMSPSGAYIVVGGPDKVVAAQQGNGVAAIFSRSGNIWTHMHSFGSSGSEGVRTGALVDISNTKVLVVNGGTRTVSCYNLGAPWSAYPYPYTSPIDGACIDPVTEQFYVWTVPTIYREGDTKAKSLSMSDGSYGLQNLFAVYNNRFVVGRPGEKSAAGYWAGGYCLGSVNQ
jgi:hypothetical protein